MEDLQRDTTDTRILLPTLQPNPMINETTEMGDMTTINSKHLIHKVPDLLRLSKSSKEMFDPFVVSIGPYHHGKPELQLVEKLKPIAVQMFVEGSNSNEDMDFYLYKIMEIINDLRSCYVEGSTDKYDNAYLANMMLQDACFLFKHGEISNDPAIIYQVGRFSLENIFHDITLLENQIPLSVLKLLDYLAGYGNFGFLRNLYSYYIGDYWSKTQLLYGGDDDGYPIHLVELSRRTCYLEDKSVLNHPKSSLYKLVDWLTSKFHKLLPSRSNKYWGSHSFLSAMDLKARGIHFKVNNDSGFYRLDDIKFRSSYFYGELQLPKWNVTIFTKVVLSNLLALENYLPEDECVVTAYIYIMKILLQNTKDVRELREKKVLINQLGTDEELLQVFLDLPITTWDTLPPFRGVLNEVEAYYRKQRNKWVAELIQTYFSSPWTTSAFLAATLFLCLTIVQTYFAVYPRR